MALSVHDNVLVSYQVLCEARTITLVTERRFVEPVEVVRVVFTGVEAYHFEDDCFGNILFDVETVPVERILQENLSDPRKAEPYASMGWARDLSNAPEMLREMGVKGFHVDATLGLCGWVLARRAVLAPAATAPDVSEGGSEFQPGLYEIAADGSRCSLAGKRLIAGLGDGRELAFTLPEPGGREDAIYVRSMFNGPGGDVQSEWGRGPRPETWGSIVVHPGGGNVMTLTVEARSASDGQLVAGPASLSAAPPKKWFLVEGETRQALGGRSFVLSLGEGRAVTLDAPAMGGGRDGVHVFAGTMPNKEEIERMKEGGPITCVPMGVGFGGGNVLHIRLGKPYGARPAESLRTRPSA